MVRDIRTWALAVLASLSASAAPGLSPPERDLIEAARAGHLARAQALLKAGADVNAAPASGITPLMEAASAGRTALSRLLVDAGADVDARDRLGRTALDLAERGGRADVVRLLRSRGARGSGKSTGDTVCVKKWGGEGFCGVVDAVEANRLRLRVTSVEGCGGGCGPDAECSGAEPIVGPDSSGRVFWVRTWCLTHTYPGSGR